MILGKGSQAGVRAKKPCSCRGGLVGTGNSHVPGAPGNLHGADFIRDARSEGHHQQLRQNNCTSNPAHLHVPGRRSKRLCDVVMDKGRPSAAACEVCTPALAPGISAQALTCSGGALWLFCQCCEYTFKSCECWLKVLVALGERGRPELARGHSRLARSGRLPQQRLLLPCASLICLLATQTSLLVGLLCATVCLLAPFKLQSVCYSHAPAMHCRRSKPQLIKETQQQLIAADPAVVNHGVSEELVAEVFEQNRAFFALSNDQKRLILADCNNRQDHCPLQVLIWVSQDAAVHLALGQSRCCCAVGTGSVKILLCSWHWVVGNLRPAPAQVFFFPSAV